MEFLCLSLSRNPIILNSVILLVVLALLVCVALIVLAPVVMIGGIVLLAFLPSPAMPSLMVVALLATRLGIVTATAGLV